MSFADDFREAIFDIAVEVPAMDDQLTQAMFAMTLRQHFLWTADVGRAKTMTARLLFGIFPLASKVILQMTRDMQRDEVFGPIIADRLLKEGLEIHNLEGGLAAVIFGFLDEFFDAPDMLQRMMLTAFLERRFETKDQKIDTPLHTVGLSSNFFRENEATRAVLDRIMFKSVVPRASGLCDRLQMYQYRINGGLVPKRLDYAELDAFSRSITDGTIQIGSGPLVMHALLMASFNNRRRTILEELAQSEAQAAADGGDPQDATYDPEEINDLLRPTSPRTETLLLDLPRGAAALCNRTDVDYADLQAIRYGLIRLGDDDTTDDQAWSDVCGWLLPKSGPEARAFDGLAQVAVDLTDVLKHREGANPIALVIAGTKYEGVIADMKMAVDRLVTGGGGTHSVQQLGKWIHRELDHADKPDTAVRFPWAGDWS